MDGLSCEQVRDLFLRAGFPRLVAEKFYENDVNGRVLQQHMTTHGRLCQIGLTSFGVRCQVLDFLDKPAGRRPRVDPIDLSSSPSNNLDEIKENSGPDGVHNRKRGPSKEVIEISDDRVVITDDKGAQSNGPPTECICLSDGEPEVPVDNLTLDWRTLPVTQDAGAMSEKHLASPELFISGPATSPIRKNSSLPRIHLSFGSPSKQAHIESAGLKGLVEDDIYRKQVVLDAKVMLADFLVESLMPHQVQGVQFMWRHSIVGRGGCILAHSMGLGKTIQVVALVFTLFEQLRMQPQVLPSTLLRCPGRLRVMIVCPPIVLTNWGNEFRRWIPTRHISRFPLFMLQAGSSIGHKVDALESWQSSGGVLLIGYHVLRELLRLTEDQESDNTMPQVIDLDDSEESDGQKPGLQKTHDHIRLKLEQLLLDSGPDLIIADEGHHIKNIKSQLSKQVNRLKSLHRACLTGYPLQNNLIEYYCMIDFCLSGYLVDMERFKVKYEQPVRAGSFRDATFIDRLQAMKKLYILGRLIAPIVHRVDNGILRQLLPPKREFVVSFNLTPLQLELYEAYLETLGRSHREYLFIKTIVLTRILNHPATLWLGRSGHDTARWDPASKRLVSGGYYQSHSPNNSHASPSREEKEVSVDEGNNVGIDLSFAKLIYERSQVDDIRHSHKLEALLMIVQECMRAGEHILLFSRSIPTLDIIQSSLRSSGVPLFRMDGSTPQSQRQSMIDAFQKDPEAPTAFLVSIMTGSLGITLTRASRVIIFDVGWNPSHDEQAIGRIFRFGQRRPTFVYRFQVSGTIDEHLYKLNVHKNSMSLRVLDHRNIEKHFNRHELERYFETPAPRLPNTPGSAWDVVHKRDPALDDVVIRSLAVFPRGRILNVRCHLSFLERQSMDQLNTEDIVEAERLLTEERERLHLYKAKGCIPSDHPLYDDEEAFYERKRDESPSSQRRGRPPKNSCNFMRINCSKADPNRIYEAL